MKCVLMVSSRRLRASQAGVTRAVSVPLAVDLNNVGEVMHRECPQLAVPWQPCMVASAPAARELGRTVGNPRGFLS